jgi:hypothetical protein
MISPSSLLDKEKLKYFENSQLKNLSELVAIFVKILKNLPLSSSDNNLSSFFLKTLKTRSLEKKLFDNFHPNPRSYNFSSWVMCIYHQFEELEDEYCTDQEVKDFVKNVYLKFQNFLNEE